MNVKADKPRVFVGKRLIAVSVLMGIVSLLSEHAAVTSLMAMIASTLLVISCLVSGIAALFRRDLALLRGRVVAIAILLFPTVAFVTNGRLHLTDRIRSYFMQDCALGGIPVGAGHHVSVCLRRDREGWGFVEAIIYDSSDQVALPQGEQSRAWSKAVAQFRLPFETLPFSAIPLGGHYYLVQFNEN